MKDDLKERLRKAYNNNAQKREESKTQEWKITVRDAFVKRLIDEGKYSLVDIGAGGGRDSEFFINNSINVTAVDLSDEMVKICRDKGIKAHRLDFYNLSELGKRFDAVWSMNSLLHVEKKDIDLVLEEISDILKPLGLFYMGIYGGDNSEGIWEDDSYTPSRFFASYTDKDIKEILSNHFDIISFERIDTGYNRDFQSIVMRKK